MAKLQIQTKRDGKITETDYLGIIVGNTRFKITKSYVSNTLIVNKINLESGNDLLFVHPHASNEISIS